MPRAEREMAMLAVAGEVFAAVGFHQASMDEIAEAAGISKPMLYNYFGSKQGLYAAYVERAGSQLVQLMVDASEPDSTQEERLHAGIVAFLTYVDEHRAGWRVLHTEASAHGGPVAAEVVVLRERVAGLLAGPFGSEAFAHAFVGAGESLANWWLEHPEERKEEIVRQLMSIAGAAVRSQA